MASARRVNKRQSYIALLEEGQKYSNSRPSCNLPRACGFFPLPRHIWKTARGAGAERRARGARRSSQRPATPSPPLNFHQRANLYRRKEETARDLSSKQGSWAGKKREAVHRGLSRFPPRRRKRSREADRSPTHAQPTLNFLESKPHGDPRGFLCSQPPPSSYLGVSSVQWVSAVGKHAWGGGAG